MTRLEIILLILFVTAFIVGAVAFSLESATFALYCIVVAACALAMLMASGLSRSRSNIFNSSNTTNINITTNTRKN